MAIATPVTTPAPTTPTPVAPKAGGVSPIQNNVAGTPTFPEGSVVDSGNGPTVTPPSDAVLYARTSNDAPVNTPPTPIASSNAENSELGSLDSAAESAVENVTKTFATKVQQFNSGGGANNVGMQNALAASNGLSGGSGGQDREATAGTVNAKTTNALNAQKEAQINTIYGNLAKTQASIKTADAKTDTTNNAAYTKQTTSEAKTALTDISGVLGNLSYAQFKAADPTTYQNILNLSGGSDAELELLYNSAMSSSTNKPTYHWESGQAFEQIGGNIVRRPDLDTSTPAAATGSTKLQIIGNTAYLFPVDSSGKTQIDPTKPLSYYAYAPVPAKTSSASTAATPKASVAAQSMAQQLNSVKGTDGYISPNDYETALQAWVNEGYTATSFKSYFSAYKNPDDTYSDDTKKSTTSSTSSSGTGGIPGLSQ